MQNNNLDPEEDVAKKEVEQEKKEEAQEEASAVMPPSGDSPYINRYVFYTGLILLFFFIATVLWASLAHIDSAAIAPGVITSASRNKMIQHQQGGIIREIFVEESQRVNAGDPLIRLDEIQVISKWEALVKEKLFQLAKEARLLSTLRDEKNVLFPPEVLVEKNNPEIAEILNNQEILFRDSRAAYLAQVETLKKQQSQIEQQKSQAKTQQQSNEKQLEFLRQELEAVKILEAKKLVNRPRLLGLQREEARLTGEIAKIADEFIRLQEQQAQIESRILEITETRRQEFLKELEETNRKLLQVQAELIGVEDLKGKAVIRSPVKGIVKGLRYHSVDEVITPGTVIMQIVPLEDPLVVEAEINPNDIDMVYPGLNAKIIINAFSSRYNPYFFGRVVYVSPDTFTPEGQQQPQRIYYLARISDFDEEWKKLEPELVPGMTVEVMIINDQRTVLDYLLTPIIESFRRAFREQ